MPETAQAEGQLHHRFHDDVAGHARPGTEAPEIALRPVLITGLCVALFAAATLAGLHVYYRAEVRLPLLQPPRGFPAPRLQQDPEGDLARLLADQRGRLAGYAWVDRERGIARIPVEAAMARIAREGDAAYAAPARPERVPPLGSRGGASSVAPSPDGRPGTAQEPASGGPR